METFDNNKRQNRRLGLGIILLIFGSIFLMKNIGLFIPFWVLSWHTILLAVGMWFGYKKNFKAGGWVLMVLVGGIFTLRDILFFDISSYIPAMVLIGLGLYLILKPKKHMQFCDFGHRKDHVKI
jgi:cellulose synthase/poly-beta-1,6-N-acetylglucosamine synthase-like glycosyltransferase